MSVNRYRPHVYVIPEDDADRQIANGFVLHPDVHSRQIRVEPASGGWDKLLKKFMVGYVPLLRQNAETHVVMVVDFDRNAAERRLRFEASIPDELRARVFVIGPLDTPESLRRALGTRDYEDIGKSLADDCVSDRSGTWDHELLRHNDAERLRLLQTVKRFLFESKSG